MKYLLIGQEPTDHLMIYPFRAKNRVIADLMAADIARDQDYTHSVLVAARDVPTLIQTMSTLIAEVKSFEKPNRQMKG